MEVDLRGWYNKGFGAYEKQVGFTIYTVYIHSDMFETTELDYRGNVFSTMIESINERVIKEINRI